MGFKSLLVVAMVVSARLYVCMLGTGQGYFGLAGLGDGVARQMRGSDDMCYYPYA